MLFTSRWTDRLTGIVPRPSQGTASSIHARGESRTYAKGIAGGASEVVLTPEERQALDAARTGEQV